MIDFEIYLKETIPNTGNLVKKTIKGHYINVNKFYVLIDNIIIANVADVHSIDFIIRGYKNVIEL